MLAGLRKANGYRKEGLPPAFSLLMKIWLEKKGEPYRNKSGNPYVRKSKVRSVFWVESICLFHSPLVSSSPVAVFVDAYM